MRGLAAIVLLVASVGASGAFAHGEGLDVLGCHNDRKAGLYHCHKGALAGQSFDSRAEAQKALAADKKPETTGAVNSQKPGVDTRFRAQIDCLRMQMSQINGLAARSKTCCTCVPPVFEYFPGAAHIIDGDTIEIAGERIRLHGIDAPETQQYSTILFVVLSLSTFVLAVVSISIRSKLINERNLGLAGAAASLAQIQELELRLKPVTDIDKEIQRLETVVNGQVSYIEELRVLYSEKKTIYDLLLKEISVFDEKLSFAEMGVYEPHFDFSDSEEYKKAILVSRDAQKAKVSQKTAVTCLIQWSVDGSEAKGKTMTNRNIKLTLRAFNNECEAATANVRWNNANAMEKRIVNAKEKIDRLNESNKIIITNEYMQLKINELRLAHEYREKIKSEREERAEMVRSAREEQMRIRDMERVEEEQANYQKMISQARAEAESTVGPKLEFLNDKIKILEQNIAETSEKLLRAQAMAELTRTGYVYIISNVGSFGDDVVKIGLTRRLDPTDRIRELGDASVPFRFDTHAIIYSDDAPTLERALHAEFELARVNVQNYRKEFFKAKLDDVEAAVRKLAPDAPFFKDVEAQEYRETLAKRKSDLLERRSVSTSVFPDSI